IGIGLGPGSVLLLRSEDPDNDKAVGDRELKSEGATDNAENQQKGEQTKASGKNAKQGSQSSDPAKEEYIHVRAPRGQATNSHSLAERLRYCEKLSVIKIKVFEDEF
ncbi:hypothetical protein L195_g038175, partial [Trifolium pratense]